MLFLLKLILGAEAFMAALSLVLWAIKKFIDVILKLLKMIMILLGVAGGIVLIGWLAIGYLVAL